MIAQELIDRLNSLSDEEKQLEVETEGCDCMGDVAEVTVDDGRCKDNCCIDQEPGRLAVWLLRSYS